MSRQNTIRLIIGLILLPVLLTGCATVVFDPRGCPRERDYTQAEDKRLEQESKTWGSMTQIAMVDYLKLRDKAKACRSVKP